MLIIAYRMANKIQACTPISFQRVSFCCPLSDSHPTIHQSNLGVCLQSDSKLHTSTNPLHKLIQGGPGVCTDHGKDLLVEAPYTRNSLSCMCELHPSSSFFLFQERWC